MTKRTRDDENTPVPLPSLASELEGAARLLDELILDLRGRGGNIRSMAWDRKYDRRAAARYLRNTADAMSECLVKLHDVARRIDPPPLPRRRP